MQDLRKILSSINDAVWSFDLTCNKFIYINDRLSELYEVPLQEIEESPTFWKKFIHPDDYAYALTESESAYLGKSVEIEYRVLVNGQIKWISDKRVVLLDKKKKPKAITGILSDITTKRLSENQLTDDKKVFRYLFLNNPNPLWIYDKKSLRFLAVNNAAIAHYGYSHDEFLSMTIADIRPREDVPELLNHVYEVRDTFSSPHRYWRHIKKNGDMLYVTISGHGLSYNGYAAEMVMSNDITIEVESRKKITLAKENLDALINNIEEVIWSIDSNYRLISSNNSFRKTTEETLGREIAIGDSIFIPEYGDDNLQWKSYYDRALRGEAFTFTELINLPGQKPYCIETKLNPIRSKNKIIGVACITTNIQERLEAHDLIIEHNRRLREIISIASHEIRGPVATLLGLSSAFNRKNPQDPFNEELMHLITDVTKSLDAVLHDFVLKSYSLKEDRKSKHSARYNQSVNE